MEGLLSTPRPSRRTGAYYVLLFLGLAAGTLTAIRVGNLGIALRGLVRGSSAAATAAPATSCPPQAWVLADMGSGHWILDHTDKTWEMYMNFLHVPPKAWSDEFNCSDIHQYVFTDRGTFVMNHTIPKTNFHLLFEAGLSGLWEKNPYPAPTPAGFDPSVAKVNLTKWRNAIDAGPEGNSCTTIRTEMPVVMNDTKTGKPVESVVIFWRELVSPTFMKCSLKVVDTDGNMLEPWASSGLSYRYFRKTVQSFADAALRLPCAASGVASDAQFC